MAFRPLNTAMQTGPSQSQEVMPTI